MISERIEKSVIRVPFSGCWLWGKSVGSHGYGQIMFKDHKPRLVHRVVYEAINGPIEDGMFVLHRCDVRSCCNPDHLFVGTQKDNMQDCKSKGRAWPPPVGTHWKLTSEQRETITRRSRNGERPIDLAREFCVSRSRIEQLRRA